MEKIAQEAFLDELTKLGFQATLLRHAAKMVRSDAFRKALTWGSSQHQARLNVSKHLTKPMSGVRSTPMAGKSTAASGILPAESSTVKAFTPKRVIGNQAMNIKHLVRRSLQAKNIVRGSGKYLKDILKGSQYYFAKPGAGRFSSLGIGNKKLKDTTTHIFQRSLVGKATAPIFTTGIGFGAMDALSKTDEYGQKKSLVKRLGSSAATTAKWTIGEPIMGAKLLAYDIPKLVLGG